MYKLDKIYRGLHTHARIKGFISPLIHYFRYIIEKPIIKLDKCILILSIDIDVGNKAVGVVNKGKNDHYVHDKLSEYDIGRIEEQALPLIINFFNDLEIPVTFAIRGQLLDVDSTIINLLLNSPVNHDIGSHSYFHRKFTHLSYCEVDNELKLVSNIMKKFKITPKSFIFPKNRVAYLDLIKKHGYECYRGYGDFMNDGMYINKNEGLYDIHPGLFIGFVRNIFVIKKIIDLSIKNRLPLHMWFHIWNLGVNMECIQKRINKVFFPLFKYAKKKEKNGLLTFETMLSASKRAIRMKEI